MEILETFSLPTLTEQNFRSVALSFYDHTDSLSVMEFEADLRRFTHVLNLMRKFDRTNVRLILNHLIILHNCFGKFVVVGLYFRCPPENRSVLRTFLEFLSLIPPNHPLWDAERNEALFQVLEKL